MDKTYKELCDEYYTSPNGIAFAYEQRNVIAALKSENNAIQDEIVEMLNEVCYTYLGKEWRVCNFGNCAFCTFRISMFDGEMELWGHGFDVRCDTAAIYINYGSMGSFDALESPMRLKLLQGLTRFAEISKTKIFRDTIFAYRRKESIIHEKIEKATRLLDNPPALENARRI